MSPMRRGAMIMTFLAGLITLSAATPARTETREALEAAARKHGAPMVWISEGAFTMGSQDRMSKTQPMHEVYVNAFYIDQYELTTARYQTFLEATARSHASLFPSALEQVSLLYD